MTMQTTTVPKERPILFSGPMVRAILDGRKTQTRRMAKGTALEWLDDLGFTPEFVADPENDLCPYGRPGDRLWVRETHMRDYMGEGWMYKADWGAAPMLGTWKPSIHMPRAASRILLEITDVRVEMLQDISEADAKAEGVKRAILGVNGGISGQQIGQEPKPYRQSFAALWQSINGPESWNENPWVWAITFKRIEP